MDFNGIHNYYENLVIEYLEQEVIDTLENHSSDYLLDIACVALSRLPARYVRHEIDMAFYMPQSERDEMVKQTRVAVDEAVKYIRENFNRDHRYE